MSVLADAGPAVAADSHPRCPGCDAALAGDERFCVACGLRLAPDELRLAALPLLAASAAVTAPVLGAPAFRRPVVRSAAITAVVVLALGIAIGATIGPAAVGETAAAQRAVVLVSAPPAAAPAAPAAQSDDAPGDGSDGGAPDEVQTLADADASDVGDAPPADAPSGETPPADDAPAGDAPGDDGETPPATPPPGSQPLAGVVVATAADGEGFTLAARDGGLLHVHASGCGVALGDDLHLRARLLANKTWAADRLRLVGERDGDVRVAGTVVWVDPAGSRYALGARGVTLFVTVPPPAAPTPTAPADPPAPAAVPPPAPPAVPALGAQLHVRLEPAPAHDGQPAKLVERARHDAPPAADPAAPAPLELAGVVQAVDTQARTVTLTLEPDAQPPLTVALAVPPQLDLARLLPAERIAVTAVAQPDGTLALSGASPDGDALAADDASALQGDQAPSEPPDGDQSTTTVVATCTSLTSGRASAAAPPPAHA